uniref:Uncharacterized protein n=1 Tax=Mustela putorius furo TaxID=9669 RepID=M3XV79_MUSPF
HTGPDPLAASPSKPPPGNEAAHRVLGTGRLCGRSSAGQPAAPGLGPPPWEWLTLPGRHSRTDRIPESIFVTPESRLLRLLPSPPEPPARTQPQGEGKCPPVPAGQVAEVKTSQQARAVGQLPDEVSESRGGEGQRPRRGLAFPPAQGLRAAPGSRQQQRPHFLLHLVLLAGARSPSGFCPPNLDHRPHSTGLGAACSSCPCP